MWISVPLEDEPLSPKFFITKCLEVLASAVGRLDLHAPSELLHRVKDGAMYILQIFIIFAKAVLWVLLFGQTHLNCNTVKNLAVVDSDVIKMEVLLRLIQDAKSKIKMSAFSLGLASLSLSCLLISQFLSNSQTGLHADADHLQRQLVHSKSFPLCVNHVSIHVYRPAHCHFFVL